MTTVTSINELSQPYLDNIHADAQRLLGEYSNNMLLIDNGDSHTRNINSYEYVGDVFLSSVDSKRHYIDDNGDKVLNGLTVIYKANVTVTCSASGKSFTYDCYYGVGFNDIHIDNKDNYSGKDTGAVSSLRSGIARYTDISICPNSESKKYHEEAGCFASLSDLEKELKACEGFTYESNISDDNETFIKEAGKR